jgi:hypothetical protein
MKSILIGLFLFCTLASFGQTYMDKKIIVTITDTSGLYQKVRIAFGKNDFQVKEDGNAFILTTFPRAIKKIPGYMIARAEISGDTVTITGIYGLTRMDDWGYTRMPNNYSSVMYMKNSKTWPILMKIAKEIGDKITYSK